MTKKEELDSEWHIDLAVTIEINFLKKLFKNTNFTSTEFDPGTLLDKAEVEHLDGLRILYEDAYMQHKDHRGFITSIMYL